VPVQNSGARFDDKASHEQQQTSNVQRSTSNAQVLNFS
jgi:hypothetical protein